MKIEELKDDFTYQDFKHLDKSELDILPYEIYRWDCCCKDCSNGTTVRDYGFAPHYFLNRNSKKSFQTPRIYWCNLDLQVWFCGKHFSYYKRFGFEVMWDKYIDHNKPKNVGGLVKKSNQNIEKIG